MSDTPTCNTALRNALFEILRRHKVSDECFAEAAILTHAAGDSPQSRALPDRSVEDFYRY